MYQQLTHCPVCNSDLTITRMYCPNCDTSIEGHFAQVQSPFEQLTPEQVQFVLTFVRCEGRLNRLEDEMGLSYPTLRNRLTDIIRALGFEPGKEEPPAKLNPDERRRILEDLEEGRITAVEAQTMLRGASR
jgi:hypothetical protein